MRDVTSFLWTSLKLHNIPAMFERLSMRIADYRMLDHDMAARLKLVNMPGEGCHQSEGLRKDIVPAA